MSDSCSLKPSLRFSDIKHVALKPKIGVCYWTCKFPPGPYWRNEDELTSTQEMSTRVKHDSSYFEQCRCWRYQLKHHFTRSWGMLRYAEVLQVLPFTGCFVTVGYVKLHLQLLRIVRIHSCVLVLVPSLDLIGQDSMLPLDGSLKLGHHLPLVSHGFPLIRHGGWKSPVFFHGLMSGKSTESTCSSARQQHSATLQVQRLVQRAWQTGHGE